MPTRKQINYLVYLVESELPETFNKVEKNNAKYPNTRADYRRMILADQLRNISHRDVDTLISLIREPNRGAVEQFIWGLQITL